MMWTHVSEHGVRLTHSETLLGLLFYMCHQLVSSDTPTRSLDLRSSLFLTVHSGALWGCQTLLHNWVAIKAVFGCIMKHGMGFVRIKMELVKASRPLIRVMVINDNGLWINDFI